MLDPQDTHAWAIQKMEAARELVEEAYQIWTTAEIRRCSIRLDDAIVELKDLDTYLKEHERRTRQMVDIPLPEPPVTNCATCDGGGCGDCS
jgi:hypothetical protein